MRKTFFVAVAASLGLAACAEPVEEKDAMADAVEDAAAVEEPADDASDDGGDGDGADDGGEDGGVEPLEPGSDVDRGNPVDQIQTPGNPVDQ